MAGYTRQDEGNISNGNIIDATDLNAEFDKLQTAFASSGGHTHDGSSDGGARIEEVGPNGEVTVGASAVTPKVSTDVDVGTASLKFNNANFKGTVSAPTFTATTGATIPSLTVGSSTAVNSVDEDLASVSTNHDTLASAKAIKTYVDSQVTAQDLDITDGTTTGSIDLDSQSLTFTGSTGINATVSNQTVTISTDDSAIAHDSLSGFVSAEHVDHSAVSITAGNGLTGGGTIESTRTLTVDPHTGIAVTTDGVALSHLGLESLTATNADRIAFWDYDADAETGTFQWLELGTNLAIDGTTLNATDTNTTYSTATTSTLGLVKLGNDTEQTVAANSVTDTVSRSYAVQLNSSDQMVVNVPWVDTNTDTTYSTATTSALGLVKLGDDTDQTVAANSVTSTASRTYAVQLNSNDQMVVNVPWTDANDNTTYTAGTGLTLDGTTFNANVDATTQTVASETVSATASRTYAVQTDSSDNLVVNVPWTSPSTLSSTGAVLITPTTSEAGSINSPEVIIKSAATPSNDTRAPDLVLYNTDTVLGTPSTLGEFQFRGDNASSNTTTFASIVGTAMWTTDADEDGKLSIFIKSDGSNFNVFEAFSQNGNASTTVASPGSLYFESGSSSPTYYFMPQYATDNNTNVDVIIRNRDTVPVDGQVLGTLRFQGEDSASSVIDYVSLEASIVDETAATQDGKFKINLYNGGSERTVFEGNYLGHTIVSAGNDIYLKPTSDDVYLQGANGTSAQVRFGLSGSSTQTLEASGVLTLRAGGSLNSTFNGQDLSVEGALSKGSGSFKIDHPLPAKTETHHLVHSFIEGPQADLIYRGRAELVDGTATVNIDTAAGMTEGTFVVLCGDVQCFTSNESGWTAVKGSVSGNTLTITAQDNTCTDTISWMVVGERKDQHMIDTDWTDGEGHVIVEPAKQ
jgi:hypothetical protein